jgi:hypothetical protein
MTMQHESLRDEIVFVIGRSSLPLDSGEIYERVELADEMKQVSNALYQLTAAGKLARVEGDGRVRYVLADGVAAPAPAGKAGRPTDAAPATAPLADPGISLEGAAGKTQRAKAADHIPQAGKMVEPSAESLADAILAKLRKQLSAQAIHSDLLESPPAPIINIHIEQVDIHLGGL